MTTESFIAVDWGTSKVRAYKVGSDNNIVAQTSSDKGASKIDRQNFEVVLAALLGEIGASNEPIVLCGMVGSTIGWKEASYVPCAAGIEEVQLGLNKFSFQNTSAMIVPGLSTRSPLNLPDVMRGEETQLLGYIEHSAQNALVCLPGTHTKWATVRDGKIDSFQTALTGELFELLSTQSILVQGPQQFDLAAFEKGLEVSMGNAENLTHLLFSVRSMVLVDALDSKVSSAYLSGLLIGSDVQQATHAKPEHLALIADEPLGNLYNLAFQTLGHQPIRYDAQTLTISGMNALLR